MDYHVPSAAEMRRNPNAVVDQLIPPTIRAAFPCALAIKIRNCATVNRRVRKPHTTLARRNGTRYMAPIRDRR